MIIENEYVSKKSFLIEKRLYRIRKETHDKTSSRYYHMNSCSNVVNKEVSDLTALMGE